MKGRIFKLTELIGVCPQKFILSATTLTSQNKVNLSSGKSPLASSIKKSRRINFLKPQSFPKISMFLLKKKYTHDLYLEQIDTHVEIPSLWFHHLWSLILKI